MNLSPEPIVRRRRILTNSAAEYVELHAGIDALRQLEDLPESLDDLGAAPEFVTELDGFAPKGLIFELVSVLPIMVLGSLFAHLIPYLFEVLPRPTRTPEKP